MVKFKKTTFSVLSVGLAACFSTSIAAMALASAKGKGGAPAAQVDEITRVDTPIDKHTSDFFDENVVSRLSDNIGSNQEISVILSLNTQSTFDAYLEAGSKGEFSDYLGTASAKNIAKKNNAASEELKKALDKAKISYKVGNSYEHLISGFEVLVRAKDYYKLANAVSGKATTIVGEVYAPAVTQIVENEVDVYPTGIFDSSNCEYQGDGVVVAVLDTGLDYTHSAFSVKNFQAKEEDDAFTLDTVKDAVNAKGKDGAPLLAAARTTANLTGEDVYVNRKVPYAYDYADKDKDVYPLSSEHGTHVAGVIAGRDAEDKEDGITGVAPNAQLAIMKVFSDREESGARSSWMLSALEDCVVLGVDVINMSLGSPAGFTTQDDKDEIEEIYNLIRKAGISLITAAGNEGNAVSGSEKNGSNPLTSNPDAGTVGSPSTYEAALSVASVGGVKTPYFLYNGDIIYFTEAATSSSKTKNFVNDILGDKESQSFQYVTISGVGRRSDYTESEDYYKGKIVLVKRGETSFEDKVEIALRIFGAAGIIIYNNVSGAISMSVGASTGAVCSVTQDEGEKLAANKTGILVISKSQTAGPFMSDFSSWGPTSDLRIKPEITAHGGEIYSAVPGQKYDRMSGTSMASPNMAGAAALVRQYVKYSKVFGENLDAIEVTKLVNQLTMSTADIVYNKNGLAYAVRKQGAGLVNIGKATSAKAYISTFEEKGGELVEMDKTKLELGDDKNKKGVYEMTFAINNVSGNALSYNIGSIVMTEGVSTTYTGHGETTVTTEGYSLSPKTEIVNVEGGTKSGSSVTVPANVKKATVTVKITLSEADKAYLNDSFEHGMYVEGFITLKAASKEANMNVPFLAFYGDWTEAPIFDEEYYDTNADELNQGINADDKLMEDAYATRVIGSTYGDYVQTLGAYAFVQDPSATPIAANKDRISLSNYEDEGNSSLNKIYAIAAGLLRNVKEWNLTITEDSTGEVIWTKEGKNQRKSCTSGITIYQSNMEIGFSVADFNLKNNTKYTVNVETYIDYGKKEDQNNVRNTFTFPLYIDFEAPIVTDVEYRSETDPTTKKTRLYADVSIYDNHYAMAAYFGRIVKSEDPAYYYSLDSFGKYAIPVYSSYNSTSKVTFELTDYIELIKQSRGQGYDSEGNYLGPVDNYNSFIVDCYDYAMNSATYEIRLPDEILYAAFDEERVELNPNETLDLAAKLNLFPETTWAQTLNFKSSDTSVVDIVGQTVIAKTSGKGKDAKITVTKNNKDGTEETIDTASITIHVRDEDEDGYRKYDAPMVYKAALTKYVTEKAFYALSNTDRDIGLTGGTYFFGNDYRLSMYPSETVKLIHELKTYFSNCGVEIEYSSSREHIATVDKDGRIVALSKGNATISVDAIIKYQDGQTEKKISHFVGAVELTVKDPYTGSGMYLVSYKGGGEEVVIPGDRGFTAIQSYAFSGYDYVDKDLSAGDVINEEDPYYSKPAYLGENETVKKVVIPEGVTTIESYAFAGMTALEEVVLPSTLNKIGLGAFYGCTNLTKINLDNVQFINERAFMGCSLEIIAKEGLSEIIAIGSYAFASLGKIENQFMFLTLPASTQSIDSGAFYGVSSLIGVTFKSDDPIKLGESVFAFTGLEEIEINAVVIPVCAFCGCENLSKVTLGKDVSVIGEEAFAGTRVSRFELAEDSSLKTSDDGKFVYKIVEDDEDDEDGKGTELILILAAPVLNSTEIKLNGTSVARGAFAGNAYIESISGDNVTEIEPYAFTDCVNLKTFNFPNLKKIGEWAFAGTGLEELEIEDGVEIGDYAFYNCDLLATVTIGDNVIIGSSAFSADAYISPYVEDVQPYNHPVQDLTGQFVGFVTRYTNGFFGLSGLETLTIGDGVTIGDHAFANAALLTSITLGENIIIKDYAFYDAGMYLYLDTGDGLDLSGVVEIGEGAFSGTRVQSYVKNGNKYSPAAEFVCLGDGQYQYLGTALYTSFAPFIVEADLSGVEKEKLGEGAFAFNQNLWAVILPEDIEEIPAFSFALCTNLNIYAYISEGGLKFGLPESVTSIGDYAFYGCQWLGIDQMDVGEHDELILNLLPDYVTSVGDYAFAEAASLYNLLPLNLDLSNVSLETVGEGAFSNSNVVVVNFAEGAEIGDHAFYGCSTLGFLDDGTDEGKVLKVTGLDKVKKIGAWAFGECVYLGLGLEGKLDLSGATEIGDFAFGFSGIQISETSMLLINFIKEVVLGENLEKIGENPFFGCPIASFAKTETVDVDPVKYPGLKVEQENYNYDVNKSKTIKVIDGVLYKVLPNDGLQLVCYPAGAKETTYTVVENTARIGAKAFYYSSLTSVTLPRSLKAIGDQAFFYCFDLTTVVFNSIQAPILEEEYDPNYLTINHLPLSGWYYLSSLEYSVPGLGISKYYMWNIGDDTQFYYGANFQYYIGQNNGNLVMVRPTNGTGYDTFIYGQYFGTCVEGSTAMSDETLKVIEMIANLKSATDITLDDEAAVEAARRAYEALPSLDQKALVSNYNNLTSAEDTIAYLKWRDDTTKPPPPSKGDNDGTVNALGIAGFTVAGILLIALAAFTAYVFLGKKKTKTSESDTTETVNEDNSSDDNDNE